jgi:hypothetical protein
LIIRSLYWHYKSYLRLDNSSLRPAALKIDQAMNIKIIAAKNHVISKTHATY